MARYDFASDNTAGAMPEVMEALARFNGGFAAGYGDDEMRAKAGDLIRELLDADAAVYFAATGTAANAIALATLAAPHEAVIVHEHSHIATDEAGAPGFFGSGVTLMGRQGALGRMVAEDVAPLLNQPDNPHWPSPAAISLTNATEYGTVYSAEAMAGLIGPAKTAGLKAHVDGARLANAVAAGLDPKDLGRMGVDILSLGGTKAGATPTEAIVLFDRALERRFGARLKHAGQLISKARFLAAPWIGMLEDGAWARRASHANAMARKLADVMPYPLAHPVEANAVFVTMDEPARLRLAEEGWFVYRFIDGSVRFMCSWATTDEGVEALGDALRRIS